MNIVPTTEQRTLLLELLKDKNYGDLGVHIIRGIVHQMGRVRQHRLSYLSLESPDIDRMIQPNGTISCSETHDCYTCELVHRTTSEAIDYFPNDEAMTRGSIYTYAHNLDLDDNRFLNTVLMKQLLSTYQKTTLWQLAIQSSLNSLVPSCLVNLIVEYYGDEQGINQEYEETKRLFMATVFINRLLKRFRNDTRVVEYYLQEESSLYNVSRFEPSSKKRKRMTILDQPISSLSNEQRILCILEFFGIVDVNGLSTDIEDRLRAKK